MGKWSGKCYKSNIARNNELATIRLINAEKFNFFDNGSPWTRIETPGLNISLGLDINQEYSLPISVKVENLDANLPAPESDMKIEESEDMEINVDSVDTEVKEEGIDALTQEWFCFFCDESAFWSEKGFHFCLGCKEWVDKNCLRQTTVDGIENM